MWRYMPYNTNIHKKHNLYTDIENRFYFYRLSKYSVGRLNNNSNAPFEFFKILLDETNWITKALVIIKRHKIIV